MVLSAYFTFSFCKFLHSFLSLKSLLFPIIIVYARAINSSKFHMLLHRRNTEKRVAQTYLLYMHPSNLGKGRCTVDFIAEF